MKNDSGSTRATCDHPGAGFYVLRRENRDIGFVMMWNDIIEDRRLSCRALGLMARLLRNRTGWQWSADSIVKMMDDGEGRDAVHTALRELVAAGYLRYERVSL